MERGKTFVQGLTGELGFYQQYYIQFYPLKRIGIQIDFGSQRHIEYYKYSVVETWESEEVYLFLNLLYKFPEIKERITPFLYVGGGEWGTDIYDFSAAMKLGTGLKYCLTPQNSIFSTNLNIGLFYMWLDATQAFRGSITFHVGLEVGL